MDEPRRRIPSVDSLLQSADMAALLAERPRASVVAAVRRALDRVRDELGSGVRRSVPDDSALAMEVRRELDAMERPSLDRVVNATGIPLHTNLGRAPLTAAARRALERVADGYANLEYDVDAGRRGSRYDHCAELLCELTGAEGALVVNNNAAALVLTLNELAEAREVIVSRGELVEIGGSFRVPEIIAKSGARIAEVGATNRTHLTDYERAIGATTGALLKVHRSNFTQSGFVADVDIVDLAAVAHDHDLPVVHDIGSGLLYDLGDRLPLAGEPTARDSLAAGADLVTFSGDKLLGGPQAGLICGRGELIERLRANPLLRAVRVGKLTLAGLEATLRAWRDEDDVVAAIPALAMIAAPPESVQRRAERLASELRRRVPAAKIDVVQTTTEVGGGSYPGGELASWALRAVASDRSETQLEGALRAARPAVIARLRDGALLVDPRTVAPGEENDLLDALAWGLSADRGAERRTASKGSKREALP